MGKFRHYSKEGILQRAVLTTTTLWGGMCYIGGSKFAVASNGKVELFQYDFDGHTLDSTMWTFTGGTPIRRGSSIESDRKGHLVVQSRHDIVAGPFTFRTVAVSSYTADTGTKDLPETSLSFSVAEGGIAYDGIHWWLGFSSTATPKFFVLAQTEISGVSPTINRSTFLEDATPTAALAQARDLCWDGTHLWALQGADVVCYLMDGRSVAAEQFRFTAAGSVHAGLATDGQDLFVISRF